jgi:hypothetical protein
MQQSFRLIKLNLEKQETRFVFRRRVSKTKNFIERKLFFIDFFFRIGISNFELELD